MKSAFLGRGRHKEDYSIWGSLLGSLCLGKPPDRLIVFIYHENLRISMLGAARKHGTEFKIMQSGMRNSKQDIKLTLSGLNPTGFPNLYVSPCALIP